MPSVDICEAGYLKRVSCVRPALNARSQKLRFQSMRPNQRAMNIEFVQLRPQVVISFCERTSDSIRRMEPSVGAANQWDGPEI